MKLNRIFTVIMILSIISCFNFYAFAEDAGGGGSAPEPTPLPKLKMASDGMYSLKANTEQDIEITVKNISSFYAYNILVQATSEKDDVPYKMNFVEKSNIKFNLQGGGSMVVKMHLDIDKNAPNGTYPINLTYSYNSKDKSNFSESDKIFIKIENKSSAPIITMSDFKASLDRVKAGNNVSVSANLENIGDFDARNLKINVTGLSPDGVGLAEGTSTLFYKEYNAGYKNQLKFNFTTHKDMKNGSYPISFKLTYSDILGKETESEYSFI